MIYPSGKTLVAGVTGWPVAQSKSPRMHNFWLNKYGIDGAYLPFPIHPDKFDVAVFGLQAAGLRGLNVTSPHKEAAFKLASADGNTLSESAKFTGTVNTLVFHEDNRIEGINTDTYGLSANMMQDLPKGYFNNKTCLLLGGGGAARAAVETLRGLGHSKIFLANRSRDKAELIAKNFDGVANVIVKDWSDRHDLVGEVDTLVNATLLGMVGKPALDQSLEKMKPETFVTDLVYNPLMTPLLTEAKARGNKVVDGLGMLLFQAMRGFELWFGTQPEVDEELRTLMLED